METQQSTWVLLRTISWQKRTGLLVFPSEKDTTQFAVRGGKMLSPRNGSLETELRNILATGKSTPEFSPLGSNCPPVSQSRLVDIGTLLRSVAPKSLPTNWLKLALSGAPLTYLDSMPMDWGALSTSEKLWLHTRRWPTTLEEIVTSAPMTRHECWTLLGFLARTRIVTPLPAIPKLLTPRQLNRQLAKLLHPDANPSSSRIEQVKLTNRLHEAQRAIRLRSVE